MPARTPPPGLVPARAHRAASIASGPRASILLLAALAIIATSYSSVGRGGFVWDDRPLILEQPAIHHLDPVGYVTRAFWTPSPMSRGHNVYYRPATTLTYALDWWLSGGSPGWFHVVNLAMHLAVCALLFGLARQVGAAPAAAALAVCVFGLLPRLTECVAWISGRTDVLAAAFSIGALWVHFAGRPTLARAGAASLLVFLGLLSKEVAVAAAVGIVAFEAARALPGDRARAFSRAAPAVIAVTAYAALRLVVLRSGPPLPPAISMPASTRFLTPFDALGRYAWMSVDALRPRLQIGSLGAVTPAAVLLGAVVAAALGFVLRRSWHRRDPVLIALSTAAAVALGLVLHIAPIRVSVSAADRFLYVPAALLAVIAARAGSAATARARRFTSLVAMAAVPVFGIATYHRSTEWTDEVTLWRRAVETTPVTNPLPIHEYASALYRAGRTEEAIAEYERVADLTTGRRRADAISDLATTLSDVGRVEEGVARMREAIGLGPAKPAYHYNLGVLLARTLDFEAAEQQFQIALAMLPSYADARGAIPWARQLKQRWNSLPAPAGDEPASVKAARAAFFDDLGVPSRARDLWRAVVQDTAAGPDDLLAAALFFTRNGSPLEASTAIMRARERGASEERTSALQKVIDPRTSRP